MVGKVGTYAVSLFPKLGTEQLRNREIIASLCCCLPTVILFPTQLRKVQHNNSTIRYALAYLDLDAMCIWIMPARLGLIIFG